MAVSKTLLEIVQDILSDMDGDEVNSINDTTEAEQVARIVRQVYRNIVSNTTWAHTLRTVGVTPFSDSNYPTHATLDEDVKELVSINYNKVKSGDTRLLYKPVEYKTPDQFLMKINGRNSDSSTVDTITDPSGIQLLILNDVAPSWYTSFDDDTLVFDSYDSDVDTTLQASKMQVLAYVVPEFTLSDSFVPDLPSDAFSYLQEESTARAQLKLREVQDLKSEVEAQKQSRWLSQKSWRTNSRPFLPNYGKPRSGFRSGEDYTPDKNTY